MTVTPDHLPISPAELAQRLDMSTVLAIAAHPDDIEFGAASTVAGLTAAGVKVVYCLVTNGDAGGFEPERQAEMTTIRQEEQRAAARVLGVHDVEFLGYRDGYVEPSHELMEELVRVMRTYRPDTVITSHPQRDFSRIQRSHPDHLAVGEAVVRAAYPAVENPFAYPHLQESGLEAYRLHSLLLMAGPADLTNVTVDVTETATHKIQALREHASQHPDPDQMEHFVLEKMRENHPGDSGSAEIFQWVEINASDTIAGF